MRSNQSAADSKIEVKLSKTLSGPSNPVSALTALADDRLAIGSMDGSINLCDVGRDQWVTLSGHTGTVFALKVLADGRLASGSRDKTIRVWDMLRGECVQILSGHSGAVLALTVLADGRLVSGSQDGLIKLWEVGRGQCVQTFGGHSNIVCALTLLADGRLASGSGDAGIKLWDVSSGGRYVQTLIGHSKIVSALKVLADGRLASGSHDNTIKLWDVEREQCVLTLSEHSDVVMTLTVLTDGRLASGSRDKTIKLWDVERGQCVQTLNHSDYITVLADGRLASGSGHTIKLWDVGTQKILKLRAEAQKEAKEKAERDKPATGLSVSFEIPYNELQVGEKLGSGGFGVVYKGKWKTENVAIKQLLDEKPSKEAVAEFKREMQIMAELRSDRVVQFKGCVLGNPKYCIVMEYMPKGSLYSVLHGDQPLNWWTRYKIARDVASGLAFLHSSSILHRDLKSLNVLLDEHYRAKLTDFGLSKLKTETRTTTKNQSVGSDGWVAPELTEPDASHTQKCDVFSMGITFWEIAARKLPYEKTPNRSFISFWYAQNKREAIPEDCPPKFVDLIKRCWDTDPAKRPTAEEAMKYLRDKENDFKPFDTDQNAAAPANAPVVVNSFAASIRK